MSPQPPPSRRVMGPSLNDTSDIMSPQPPPKKVMGPSLTDTNDTEIMSPQPPPKRVMGPSLTEINENKDTMSPQPPPSRRVMGPSLSDTNDTEIMSPQPPPSRRVMGPSLTDNSDTMSPQPLPPKRVMGPSLNDSNEDNSNNRYKAPSIGPSRPMIDSNNDDDSSDDDQDEQESRKREWERVRNGGDKNATTSNAPLQREEWMTMLPTSRTYGGNLQNRQFSQNSNVNINGSDTSGWTDTPQQIEEKKRQRENNPAANSQDMFRELKQRETEQQMQKYQQQSSHRSESLLDQHLKKTKTNDGQSKGASRFEFDKDKDMEVGKIDREHLRNIVSTSKLLDTKFSKSSWQ
ncbi:hypothetical protein CYY_002249 [Polysphondylium violaceum]|uniref:DUF3752 domain-containing protein n=1 Tax=Polysphondylium violaceum TaxID=133409 RepID=A0A8J4PYR3_9MYCE|nr:hypothetical protein CYY_002249 [Polysphondylium violaceum]